MLIGIVGGARTRALPGTLMSELERRCEAKLCGKHRAWPAMAQTGAAPTEPGCSDSSGGVSALAASAVPALPAWPAMAQAEATPTMPAGPSSCCAGACCSDRLSFCIGSVVGHPFADSEVTCAPPCPTHAPPGPEQPDLGVGREGRNRDNGERGAYIWAVTASRNKRAASFTAAASARSRVDVSSRSKALEANAASRRRIRAMERRGMRIGRPNRHWRPRTHACSNTAEAAARRSRRRASSARACVCSSTAGGTARRSRRRASSVRVCACSCSTAAETA